MALPVDIESGEEILRSCDEVFVIAVEDGFYQDEWLWFPDLPPEAVEAWWCTLDDVETFWSVQNRSRWPGKLVRIDEDARLSERWQSIWRSGAYRARVGFNGCLDSEGPDSYLRRSDGTIFLHRGAACQTVAPTRDHDDP